MIAALAASFIALYFSRIELLVHLAGPVPVQHGAPRGAVGRLSNLQPTGRAYLKHGLTSSPRCSVLPAC